MAPSAVAPAAMTLQRYGRLSRTPVYGVLAALPLLVLYEVLIEAVKRARTLDVRNGAEVLLGRVLAAVGAPAALGLTAVLVALGALYVVREQRRAPVPIDRRVFGWMLVESAALALAIGPVVSSVTALLLGPLPAAWLAVAAQGVEGPGPITRISLSLGAGLYEELVFRVLLVSAIAAAVRASGRVGRRGALAWAVVTSALLFSLAHYRPFNPAGEMWAVASFTYRFVAGLAFSALYAVRGFGVAAWTHALYDVWIVLR